MDDDSNDIKSRESQVENDERKTFLDTEYGNPKPRHRYGRANSCQVMWPLLPFVTGGPFNIEKAKKHVAVCCYPFGIYEVMYVVSPSLIDD
jgi:hypothetical protein